MITTISFYKSMLKPLIVALPLILMPLTAAAALNAYMLMKGETQGDIHGGVTQAGREDTMAVTEFGHTVSAGVDAGGYIPGKIQHRAIRVTKEIDQATPLLMRVLTENELLTNVTIRFWRPNHSGQEEQFYTVELTDAYIVNINQSNQSFLQEDWRNQILAPMLETLTITYKTIKWTWEDGEITHEDDWGTE